MTNANTETRARRIIERLKMFNRKERDHLMKFALCESPNEPKISVPLWRLVSGNKGLRRPENARMFMGMDYHLNWLYAALATAEIECIDGFDHLDNCWGLGEQQLEKIEPKIVKGKKVSKDKAPIQGNQEDADLLIAWIDHKDRSLLHLTLVEAKLDSPWKPAQLESKMQRFALLQAASHEMGLDWINWNCLLLSPGRPVSNPKEEYLKVLKNFCTFCDPMSWKWEEWDGSSPQSGRRHVNRLKGDPYKWRIS